MTTTKKDLILFLLASLFFLMMWLGIHFNYNTILKNDCRMPVSSEVVGYSFKSGGYFSYDSPDEIENYFWTDRLRFWGFLSEIGTFSWGDVLLFLGYAFYIFMTACLLIDYTLIYLENREKSKHGN